MLDIYIWSVFISGLGFTSFGIFAYLANKEQFPNKMFAVFSTCFAVWCYSWFLSLSFRNNYESALFWARILNLGAIIIPVVYMHWTLSIIGEHKKHKNFLIIAYMITAVFASISFSSYFIDKLYPVSIFPIWPHPGVFYLPAIVICYGLFVGYPIYLLFFRFLQSTGELKFQQGYLLIGALLGFGGGVTNFFMVFNIGESLPMLMYFISLVGMWGTFASAVILSYAAIRYRLMNVKLIAMELFIAMVIVSFTINLILADTFGKTLAAIALMMVVFIFSILIIRSMLREISQREKIQALALRLANTNESLELANEKLQVLDKQKTEFVSIASHQLRSPLTAIKGYSSMLLEGSFGSVASKPAEAIRCIFESSQRLVNIIEDFLNITRIELGRMKYELADIDLGQVAETVVSDQQPAAARRGLQLTFSADDASHLVNADSGKITQVISNLIDNAVKYTPKGSIAVTVKRMGEQVRVEVKDTGVGINAEIMPKLFEKFLRADDAGQTNISGTGLGLYVAKQIVEAHNGRIWAESAGKDRGSAFIVELKGK